MQNAVSFSQRYGNMLDKGNKNIVKSLLAKLDILKDYFQLIKE